MDRRFGYTSKKHNLRPMVDSIIIFLSCSNSGNRKLLALSQKIIRAVAVFESDIYTKGVQFLKCLTINC